MHPLYALFIIEGHSVAPVTRTKAPSQPWLLVAPTDRLRPSPSPTMFPDADTRVSIVHALQYAMVWECCWRHISRFQQQHYSTRCQVGLLCLVLLLKLLSSPSCGGMQRCAKNIADHANGRTTRYALPWQIGYSLTLDG